jgi:hypothetical protein
MPHKYQTNRPLSGNITTPLWPELEPSLNRNGSAVSGGILYYKLPFVILTLIENPTSNSHWRVLLWGQYSTKCYKASVLLWGQYRTKCWSLSFVMRTVQNKMLKPQFCYEDSTVQDVEASVFYEDSTVQNFEASVFLWGQYSTKCWSLISFLWGQYSTKCWGLSFVMRTVQYKILKRQFFLWGQYSTKYYKASVLLWRQYSTKCYKVSVQLYGRYSAQWRAGIATGYGLDDWGVGVRVSVGTSIFTFPHRPDRLWGSPSLLSNRYRGPFPRG